MLRRGVIPSGHPIIVGNHAAKSAPLYAWLRVNVSYGPSLGPGRLFLTLISELIMLRRVVLPPLSGHKPEVGNTPGTVPEIDTGGERRV